MASILKLRQRGVRDPGCQALRIATTWSSQDRKFRFKAHLHTLYVHESIVDLQIPLQGVQKSFDKALGTPHVSFLAIFRNESA